MKPISAIAAFAVAATLAVGLIGCGQSSSTTSSESAASTTTSASASGSTTSSTTVVTAASSDKADIEAALDLANVKPEWTYSDSADAWTMAPVTSSVNAELPDYQGVSVCVPGAYVKGVDTDGDGTADTTSGTASGALVIDRDAKVTSTNGQVYTASTAPVIVNTGAAGYSAQSNQTAATTYAAEGYVNVACGNRGKQSALSDGTYTGDAPACLVDQKNAVRFVKFNILLGNLPGGVDYFVSTGGSGGGAHAAMLAATSDNPVFYDYEIAQGAVGVYADGNGGYSTTVTVDGTEVALSDGMWGCMAYSAITSLAEADMALAFEYTLDPSYGFSTQFQKQVAAYLAAEYADYINGKGLSVKEGGVGFDLNGDGDMDDEVALTIENGTDGYSGTYMDLYLAELEQSLGDYISRLAYADDWTWFDADGNALTDDEVAAMTDADRAKAFISGAYAKGSTGSGSSDMGGGPGGDRAGGPPNMSGGAPSGAPSGSGPTGGSSSGSSEEVGTPDAGTTQAAGSTTDSANYSSYTDMLAAYKSDIAEIEAGDAYGNNIVELYDPTRFIGAEGTSDPTWARVLMGASEGDISMFNSLNLQVAWLNAGTDAVIEWQWNGGHVPSEIFGDSLALYVDEMYGKHVEGAVDVTKAEPTGQSANGTETEASGTDLSSWVTYGDDGSVTMTLAGAAAYRTSGASKAIPAFDVIDYGQEDYEFGSATADARHWSKYVLKVFEENEDALSSLFNAG